MWTVVNLVDRFSDRYDFFIVTRNYESKGDRKPYTTVTSSAWNTVGAAQVFYLSDQDHSQRKFASIVKAVAPDAVFLNSALSMPVVRFLSVRRKKLIDPIPVILAPCGEFSTGALSIKPLKKKLFLKYAKAVRLYDEVIWKASFSAERDEIKAVIGSETEVWIAPDLTPRSILPDFEFQLKPQKLPGAARFVFLSRITKKKNIDYFLERLAEINEGSITLDLVGPVEDGEYWKRCLEVAAKCSSNIRLNIEADFIPYEEGLQRMIRSHFFVLPTLGENFGYVFLEAMAAGTPLLISDKTVWSQLHNVNAGWQIPLGDTNRWVETIKHCVAMGPDEYRKMSLNAREYAMGWLGDTATEEATKLVLKRAVTSREVAVGND